jgi:hypothetical protein
MEKGKGKIKQIERKRRQIWKVKIENTYICVKTCSALPGI